jgi:CHAT domain-containing protein/Tfp pilus assembly protein PilF
MKRFLIIISILLMCSVAWAEDSKDNLVKEANALNQKIAKLYNEGKYRDAVPLAERALSIMEKARGPEHPDTAMSLHYLALLYETTGRYAEAEPLYKRSLEIKKKALGPEHFSVAVGLNNLALLYETTGRYAEAEPLYKSSLAIKKKVLGPEHLSVAVSLSNLAGLYKTTGRYAEAEPLYRSSLAISEKTLGPEHLNITTSLNNLAVLYKTTGRYAEAEPLYKRSLAIREKALGSQHPDVAISLNNLATLYHSTARYAEAESLFKRVLEITEKTFGPEHTDTATSLNNLASLYFSTARYSEAERLLSRALSITEKAFGPEHTDTATSLNNLAELYRKIGRYSEAEPLLKRSLAIREKTIGPESPDVAFSLNGLASLYYLTGRYDEAEPLFRRTLAIWEKTLGPESPDLTYSLNNLGVLYKTTGRYAEAEPLYKRTLAIREKTLGPDHPETATSLDNLAVLYCSSSRPADAEPLFKRALAIREKAFGPEHPDVATSLNNLAGLYGTIDRHPESHKLFARGFSINDKERENIFGLLSEKQKIAYMKGNEFNIQSFISHSSGHMLTDPGAIADTFNAWLKWKGSVAESQSRYMEAALYSDNPETKKKYGQLAALRREIAKLQLSKPEKMTPEQYREQNMRLEKQKEALEAELSGLSKDFALDKMAGRADINKLAEILPGESVYVDIANIRIYDFRSQKWGKPRYLAFVLIKGRQPVVKLLDIADTEETDRHINAYLNEMKRAAVYGLLPRESILAKEAKAVYGIVFKPLESFIKGKKQIYISPDGNLNLIPFEALMTAEGRYLMEDHEINYIGAGRDIVRFTDTNRANDEALIIADPDYDMGLKEKEAVAGELMLAKTVRGDVSKDLRGIKFSRLPDTKKEADVIVGILSEKMNLTSQSYQDKKAMEEALFSAKSPKILHLATHGYFLKKEEEKPKEGTGRENKGTPDTNMENPMLRSGLALAGVNVSLAEGRDNGLVSAEKILGLKLKGTDLVVLSACETGVGDVQTGEGVFGLKRAFILSGARTIVMSLWSVPSKETMDLMTDFYRLMTEGKTKAEALRQAKMNMKAKEPNPFYWGAFVMTGKPD